MTLLLTLALGALALAAPSPVPAKHALVPWTTYRAWAPSKRLAYVREARRAAARLERPRPMIMDICLMGGVLREVIPGNDGCPTFGNGCDAEDDGFSCGAIYEDACVARAPVDTLTSRCFDAAGDPVLTREEYQTIRAGFDQIVTQCENPLFSFRNAEGCELFTARLAYLNERYGGGGDGRRASAAVAALVTPVPKPKPAAPVCRGEPYRVYQDGGGVVATYMKSAAALGASGRKLEIKGVCASACLLLIAGVPRERVCVAPGARLGFHQARDIQTGQVDRAFTEVVVAKYYTPELKDMWANHYSDTTQMNFVNYPELATYYATCDTPSDVCSPYHQAAASDPAATEPGDVTTAD